MDQQQPTPEPPIALTRGEFAPVYWEPLGRRGERLVVGHLLALDDLPAQAHATLHHRRLLEFISNKQSESAAGVIAFTFDLFKRTLDAGGIIEDLRPPFSSMSIGRIERISARTPEEAELRATRLCTLLGEMPNQTPREDGARTTAKTLGFLRDVRTYVRSVDKELARLAMNTRQVYGLSGANFRLHFQHDGHYVQFCSLPQPNARPETATECSARLSELSVIRAGQEYAKVALCINTQTMPEAAHYQGRTNATHTILQKTLAMARALKIETHEYPDPAHAARYLRELVKP